MVNSNILASNPKEGLNEIDLRNLTVGIDFDNTIVSYDELMYETAVSWRLLDVTSRRDKKGIRDQLRSLPGGENHWRRLQTYAYGEGMRSAHLMDGVTDFLHYCRMKAIPVWIVSHKTEYNNFGPPTVNLRQAAMTWLTEQGFFNEALTGLTPERVFFEPTLEEKVARIAALAPDYFVDDLEETFQEPTFPSEVGKIHYLPHEQSSSVLDVFHANSWSAILQFVQTLAAERAGGAVSMTQSEMTESLAQLLGEPIAGIEKIGAGGNSRVYRVDVMSGSFAAKCYFQRTADGRDRLDAEFGSLRFLWDHNIRCIAQPLVADRERQIAVYQYLPGSEIPAEHVTEANIDQLTEFLANLRALSADPDAAVLPRAAEASFSVAGIVENIRSRFDLLQGVSGEKAIYQDLTRFLHDEFTPALGRWETAAQLALGEAVYSKDLPPAARTLSPSDLGFHNALLGDDGRLSFLDFEYFGWDDPAKMISDFLWHPRATMADALKDRYVNRLMAVFSDLDGLDLRLHAVFPLFGLKWCMILLNEFRPENLARRRFANGSTDDIEPVLVTQLAKARNTLARVEQGPKRFS